MTREFVVELLQIGGARIFSLPDTTLENQIFGTIGIRKYQIIAHIYTNIHVESLQVFKLFQEVLKIIRFKTE